MSLIEFDLVVDPKRVCYWKNGLPGNKDLAKKVEVCPFRIKGQEFKSGNRVGKPVNMCASPDQALSGGCPPWDTYETSDKSKKRQ